MTNIPKPADPITKGLILLAEDEPTDRAILCGYLRGAGYAVDETENGREAWEKLQKNPYMLVLTDRRMPEMDGLELSRRIKKTIALSRIPVIMQTSATAQEEIAEGVKAGVFYYLAKPYDRDTLLSIVDSAVRDFKQKDFFEQRMSRHKDALETFMKGEFHLRMPEEAGNVALLLGSVFPRPELAVAGLYELFLNAIEHGNLGIGFAEKARLLAAGEWNEEIERRLALTENAEKWVLVQFTRSEKSVEIVVTDSGPGFDWRPFMEIEPSRATQGSGRGIAKANLLAFDGLEFLGRGNQVRVISAI